MVEPLLEDAGAIALKWFRTNVDTEDKGKARGFDPVTVADRAIEELLRAGLAGHFPDHQIVGEEAGASGPDHARYRWLIDPIDGTKAFITGSPLWGTLLGLAELGSGRSPEDTARPVAGWLHQPYLEETFSGIDGHGAWLDRRDERVALQTRQGVGLDEAIVYCTSPAMFSTAREQKAFDAVSRRARLVRFGGDCYAYAQLAMGHVDLVIDAGLKPYDIIPIIPIIEQAGGIVTGPDGSSAADGGFVIAAGNPDLHDQVLTLVAGLGGAQRTQEVWP